MSSTNLLKIGLVLLILFTVGEVIFTFQKYGKDLFKPKPGSCKILEEKYCDKGKVIQSKNNTYIGFKLTVGTRIFSTINGADSKIKLPVGGPSQGYYINIFDPNNRNATSWNFTGDIQPSNMNTELTREGQTFVSISNTGANFKGYDLLINASVFDATQNKAATDLNSMKKLFKF